MRWAKAPERAEPPARGTSTSPVAARPGKPASTALPPPSASVTPGPTRNTGAGRAAVASCWADNEGAVGAGTAASSVSVSVTFSAQDSVQSVIIGGPASAHGHFRSCAVSRLSSTRFGPGEGSSASWSQSLPASPAKK